jgi:hypothetical protein
MKEITSRRNKLTQIVTDDEWKWLKDHGMARGFTVTEMSPPKALTLPKLIAKEILKPKIDIKPEIKKPEVKNKKK